MVRSRCVTCVYLDRSARNKWFEDILPPKILCVRICPLHFWVARRPWFGFHKVVLQTSTEELISKRPEGRREMKHRSSGRFLGLGGVDYLKQLRKQGSLRHFTARYVNRCNRYSFKFTIWTENFAFNWICSHTVMQKCEELDVVWTMFVVFFEYTFSLFNHKIHSFFNNSSAST